ncbi:hypothetical protein FQN52_003086 [Onygenales sp. PD_12]|nr:hypothetical protein FQN52_003086 [Onygenales sp. PD_12]
MLTLLHPLYRTVSAPEILPAESAARKSLARAEVKAGGTPLSLALVAVCTVILYPAVTSNASEYRVPPPFTWYFHRNGRDLDCIQFYNPE